VCSGPFRFVERVAQDRIVLERFPGYWNKGEIHFDRVVYQPIADSTVRLANLRSGQLDFIERLAGSDVAGLKSDSRFKIDRIVEIGYQGIYFNIGKGEPGQKSPVGRDARVREAFELSLDRAALVKVAMDGEAQPGNQWVSPSNRYYAKNVPIPKRDVAKAKALLAAAGVPSPAVTLMTPTESAAQRIAQVVQSMAKEAGFDIKIQSTEFASSLALADKGQFEAYVLAWSGRADPDGNLQIHLACKAALNYSGYCNAQVDELINKARSTLDPAQRVKLYEQLAEQVNRDRPIVYIFHRHWLWGHSAKLTGLRTVPDGMVRLQGLRMAK
jgi:peptide/nickel transport system substrate-binding protein